MNMKVRPLSRKKQKNPRRWLTVIDLFCGGVGVTEGLKHHNFRIIAAADKDENACKTTNLLNSVLAAPLSPG